MCTEGLHPVSFCGVMSSGYEVNTLLARAVYGLLRYFPGHIKVGTAARRSVYIALCSTRAAGVRSGVSGGGYGLAMTSSVFLRDSLRRSGQGR